MTRQPPAATTAGPPGAASSGLMSRFSSYKHHPDGSYRGGMMVRTVKYVGGKVKTSLALVGAATAIGAYLEYKRMFPKELADDGGGDGTAGKDGTGAAKSKRQALYIPFHRIDLKDKHRQRDLDALSRLGDEDAGAGSSSAPIKMETRELVDLIHRAAADPNVVALYGTFGHGSTLARSGAGWADLEEVRNALKVFKESHRIHAEPNTTHAFHQIIQRKEAKPLYAYSDDFGSLGDPGNKDYYLASIFTHIHMQEKGQLNLFGLLSQQLFIRGLLEQYGIILHVFKHGLYKNAPNMFTDTQFTKQHRENVTNILESLNTDICNEITVSRSKALLAKWLKESSAGGSSGGGGGTGYGRSSVPNTDDKMVWKRIHDSGTFPATTAWKGGLVDFICRRDPFIDLVASNKERETGTNEDKGETKVAHSKADAAASGGERGGVVGGEDSVKEEMKKKWQVQETDFDRFKANKVITLQAYAKQLRKSKEAEDRKKKWCALVHEHPTLVSILEKAGVSLPYDDKACKTYKKKEEIALMYVTGAIGDKQARKVVNTIRKLRDANKKDKENKDKTKCLVIRVNSPGGSIHACETISEELKGLDIPVVFSFGNVAASGGYYIASMADRIFCSNKTITGSIGVFGIRPDFTQFAARYGITVEHVVSGNLSALYNPLYPMTRNMKKVYESAIDKYYADFKNVVASGRNGLSLDEVERIAQGRVWTGIQAKGNGLVDELGGMHRAIAYARRTYCSPEFKEEADVVVWPRKRSLMERLSDAAEESKSKGGDMTPLLQVVTDAILRSCQLLTYGNSTAVSTDTIVDRASATLPKLIISALTNDNTGKMSGYYYTVDENAAIRCLVGEELLGGNDDTELSSELLPVPSNSSLW